MGTIDLTTFEEYMREEELSENTINAYISSVTLFLEEYPEFNKDNVLKWKEAKKNNLSPKTINLKLSAFEKYSKCIKRPLQVKRIRIQKEITNENIIDIKEYNKLVKGLKKDGQEEWALRYAILGKTGARIGEALQFTTADFERGYAQIYTKGKNRKVYFPNSLRKEVLEHFKKKGNVIFKNKYGERMTTRGVAGMLKKHAEKYGIPLNKAYPHSFRHMFAIEFLKRNNNIALLADLLGHSSVNTTMIYARLSQEDQINAINNTINW